MTDPNRATRNGVVVWGVLVAASMAVLFSRLRSALFDRRIVPGVEMLVWPAAITLGMAIIVAAVWLRKNWK